MAADWRQHSDLLITTIRNADAQAAATQQTATAGTNKHKTSAHRPPKQSKTKRATGTRTNKKPGWFKPDARGLYGSLRPRASTRHNHPLISQSPRQMKTFARNGIAKAARHKSAVADEDEDLSPACHASETLPPALEGWHCPRSK